MIFFLYGDDSYSSAVKLNEIKEKFRREIDPSGINLSVFDAENFDLEKFNSTCSQGGFLVKKRLIIAKNLLINKPNAQLALSLVEIIKKTQASENIFIFIENGQPDKRTALFKLLNGKKNFIQEFKPLNALGIKKWLAYYAKKNNANFKGEALDWLSANSTGNLWQLAGEMDKMIAYKKNQPIAADDVKTLVRGKIDDNIFKLTEAMALGDKKTAIKMLAEQFEAGLNENYLLTMVVRQFRIIAQLASLGEQNISELKIVKETGLHPYVVKKTLSLAKKFSSDQLKGIYRGLANLDKKLKSTSLSAKALFDLMVMKM